MSWRLRLRSDRTCGYATGSWHPVRGQSLWLGLILAVVLLCVLLVAYRKHEDHLARMATVA